MGGIKIKVNHTEGHFFCTLKALTGVARGHGSRAGASMPEVGGKPFLHYHYTVKVSPKNL